jgi:hypothetical protein
VHAADAARRIACRRLGFAYAVGASRFAVTARNDGCSALLIMHDFLSAVGRCATFALAAFVSGCSAHASGALGDRAVYVAAYDAYVVSKEPANPEKSFVFVNDALTGKKLRCREDVEARLGPNASAAEDWVNDEYWGATSLIAMAPVSVPGATLSFFGEVLIGGSMVPHAIGAPRKPERLLKDAYGLFGSGRYAQAAPLFEVAMLRDNELRRRSHAAYYLGLAYEQLYENERATDAFRFFVENGTVRDEGAYLTARQRLERLGHPLRACRSREPVAIAWPKPHQ